MPPFTKTTGNKSVFMLRDPYHTPGYDGHIPGYKFVNGASFGTLTGKLLRAKGYTSSGNLVLSEVYPSHTEGDVLKAAKDDLVKTRKHSLGDQKFTYPMVPGYTGCIPMYKECCGKTFREVTRDAITAFENEQRKNNKQRQAMATVRAVQSENLRKKGKETLLPDLMPKYSTPLPQVAKDAAAFQSRYTKLHGVSPYDMAKGHPEKFFITGYASHVPREHLNNFGVCYPKVSNTALERYHAENEAREISSRKPFNPERPSIGAPKNATVYPMTSGIVPNYSGHIPEQKYRFGQTFTESTINAAKIHRDKDMSQVSAA